MTTTQLPDTASPSPLEVDLAVLPKVSLHDHLDGGLRVGTVLDLAREAGVDVPADTVEGLAEWIQYRARIPLGEYRKLADSFNPTGFNARQWVQMAVDAGAKYFVYTAKHHDGFAMYHSKVSKYNIVDATPFDRDPLAELAEACAEAGIMLGLYYSQVIDWEDPDAVGPRCNDWDFDPDKGDFQIFLNKPIV